MDTVFVRPHLMNGCSVSPCIYCRILEMCKKGDEIGLPYKRGFLDSTLPQNHNHVTSAPTTRELTHDPFFTLDIIGIISHHRQLQSRCTVSGISSRTVRTATERPSVRESRAACQTSKGMDTFPGISSADELPFRSTRVSACSLNRA